MGKKRFLASALVGFCLLLAGGEIQAQPGAIKLTVKETAKEGTNKGEWVVTTEIKNTDTAPATVVFWSWPATEAGKKIGDLKWHPAGTVPKSNDADSRNAASRRHRRHSEQLPLAPELL